jgi:hypothetical protein
MRLSSLASHRSLFGAVLRLLLLTLPALALVVGCQSLHLLPRGRTADKSESTSPAAPTGLPRQHEVRIAPYLFLSDFEVPRDQPLFRELASLRDQVVKELLLPPGTAEVRVYLFESRQRYKSYMQSRYPELPDRRAFFVAQPRSLGGDEDLLVYTYWGDRIRQDLRHELTHALLHSVIRDVPLWLDEGLAEFFELPPDTRGLNRSHLDKLQQALASSYRPDLSRLEALKQVDQMNPAEYRESWAWVHLMLRSRPEAKTVLLSYLQQLRGARFPGPLRQRLAKVFPDPEQALQQHLGRLGTASVQIPPPPITRAARP